MIFDGSLSIVAFPPRKSPGYGANGGSGAYDQGSLVADSTGRTVDPNTLDTNSTRLTMVGINTYLPRCVVDFSGASPTINSYMLLPSLSSTDIATMAGMYQNANDAADDNNGVRNAKRLTPDGVPGGALLYNTTTDKIQVRNTASTFRNLNPVVAFATIDSGSLVSSDGYNLALSNSSNDANFTFSTALQSANYTVIVSNQGTSTFTVPEGDKATSGFKITFSSSANARSYSVMILQV